jgi:hypothetical protein
MTRIIEGDKGVGWGGGGGWENELLKFKWKETKNNYGYFNDLTDFNESKELLYLEMYTIRVCNIDIHITSYFYSCLVTFCKPLLIQYTYLHTYDIQCTYIFIALGK